MRFSGLLVPVIFVSVSLTDPRHKAALTQAITPVERGENENNETNKVDQIFKNRITDAAPNVLSISWSYLIYHLDRVRQDNGQHLSLEISISGSLLCTKPNYEKKDNFVLGKEHSLFF